MTQKRRRCSLPEWFRRASEVEPTSPAGWTGLARVALERGEMDEAEGLRQSVDLDNLEQDISSATKVDVDVNLDMSDTSFDDKTSQS